MSGVRVGLEGLKRSPTDLFSTTGGQHRSEGVDLLRIG